MSEHDQDLRTNVNQTCDQDTDQPDTTSSKLDKPKRKLTVKQTKFVEAYMGAASGNGVKAAELAGYSAKSKSVLATIAHENLRKPEILEAIRSRTNDDQSVADRQERLAFLSELMRDQTARKSDRLKAVEILSKLAGDMSNTIDVKIEQAQKREELDLFLEALKSNSIDGKETNKDQPMKDQSIDDRTNKDQTIETIAQVLPLVVNDND